MTTCETIGGKIRLRRIELGLIQQEVADLSGVGLNTLVALEWGRGNPSLKTLLAILETLGLELDDY
ncbi:MAG: helix-turn-helix transcriptional regulator [Bacteroidales bacterium]|nr:helix-turn-helix transcriptional regulator [Bacteroidales bacterium]